MTLHLMTIVSVLWGSWLGDKKPVAAIRRVLPLAPGLNRISFGQVCLLKSWMGFSGCWFLFCVKFCENYGWQWQWFIDRWALSDVLVMLDWLPVSLLSLVWNQ